MAMSILKTISGMGQLSEMYSIDFNESQISAAYLAVEYLNDLHGGLMCQRDIRIAGSGMTDDADILVEINGVHLGQLSHTGDRLQKWTLPWLLSYHLYGTCGTLLDQH